MLGLVARADQRGIGIMTGEFHKHMHPDKVLVVSHGQWPQDFSQYSDAGWFGFTALNFADLSLGEATCREFLEGLDVVYCVETLYDWRFKQWAEEAGCRVVIHGMPELYATTDHLNGRPQPDQWMWPTPWLIDTLPDGPVVPVPVPWSPFSAANPEEGPLRVVHVAGVRAAGDRNGTVELLESLRYIHEQVAVTIYTQDDGLPVPLPGYRDNVSLSVVAGGVSSRWQMYADEHVMVLPRRYGGLCLPALEAMSTGLTAVLPDVPPNNIWPGRRIPTQGTKGHLAPYGFVPSAIISPHAIAKVIDNLARNRDMLAHDMTESRLFAEDNSWEQLGGVYERWLS